MFRNPHVPDLATHRRHGPDRWGWFAGLGHDARYAFRRLRKHWQVSAIATICLGVALALCVLTFALLDTLLLRIPVAADPERLVMLRANSDDGNLSYPDLEFYRANNRSFSGITAVPFFLNMSRSSFQNSTLLLVVNLVADDYFSVMGIRPYLGRFFVKGEDRDKSVAILTYSGWKHLGSDPSIVGKRLRLGKQDVTIVGVAPPGFVGAVYGFNTDVIATLGTFASEGDMKERDHRWLLLIGRLRSEVSRQAAVAEVRVLSSQLETAFPKEHKGRSVRIERLTVLPPDTVPKAQRAGAIALASVLVVLAVACFNVANLLLTLALGRKRDALIRMAAGAPRFRLIREFLLESTLLCIAGGAVAWALAAYVAAAWSNFNYGFVGFSVPVNLNLQLSPIVLLSTTAVVLAIGIATGLGPALLYSRISNLAEEISGTSVASGRGVRWLRLVLVASQIAVSTLVLAGCGLFVRSLLNLRSVDPGFGARNLVGLLVAPPEDREFSSDELRPYYARWREQARLPGVEAVVLAYSLPMMISAPTVPVGTSAAEEPRLVSSTAVDENYFSTLRITVLAGRTFRSTDGPRSPRVVVVNQKLADTLWPGRDPVGQVLRIGDPKKPAEIRTATVVGMVANGKYQSLSEPTRPLFYTALAQQPTPQVTVIVRTGGDPRRWLQPMRGAFRADRIGASEEPITYSQIVDSLLVTERISTQIGSVVGLLALLLAAVGIYAAMSHSVKERRKELGIRLALGAGRGQLLTMILTRASFVAAAGVALGLALSVGLTNVIRSLLYQVAAVEWTVLVPVTIAMLTFSVSVAWLGARRHLLDNPMEALRHT